MFSPIIIVFIVILFLIISLYTEIFRPVIAFLIAIAILFLFRVIDVKDILSGFSNEQIATIFLLLIISEVINKSSILDVSLKKIFRPTLSYKGFLWRMSLGVSSVSAFVNNTPLVAIMMPYIYNWAKKKNIAPSKVLIPLSYATILGGTITLIGTSTNLVVNGLAVEAGLPALKMFDFVYVGVPLTIIGILYLVFIGAKLLPSRKDALTDFKEKSREYLVETQVPKNSVLIGKNIGQAKLRNLRGLFLVEIVRQEKRMAPVPPNEIIEQGDVLIFAGDTETIVDLIKSSKDLALPHFTALPKQEKVDVVEAVLSSNSSLMGKRVKDANFRGNYDAAIIAINRHGERLSGKIGEIKLEPGDLLLIIAGKNFINRVAESQDLYIISTVKEIDTETHPANRYQTALKKKKSIILTVGVVSAFALAGFGVISLFMALLSLLCLIAVLNIVKIGDLKNSIDINLIGILALSLAIGKAITKSGADKLFADFILNFAEPFHSPLASLAGIYLITNILAMLVTNKAAVAITFPISYALFNKLGLTDPTPFVLVVAYAGCAEFITPYGYQTNLMVMGPGGYKFKDYLKVGSWLSLIYMITCLWILGYIYKLF